MTILLTLTFSGTDSGPFDLYQDSDGYTVPFATAVDKAALTLGIEYEVDPSTTIVKVFSDGVCYNYVDVTLEEPCFKILPTNSNWILDQIVGDTASYLYGNFTGYTFGSASFTEIRLMKINANLTIDATFNVGTGLNAVYYGGSTIKEDANGKIIASGTFTTYQGFWTPGIVRINTDGTRDATFVVGGGFTGSGGYTQRFDFDSLGRIIVPGIFSSYNGNYSPRVARLNTDGTYDNTLVVGDGFNNATHGVLMSSDGNDSFYIGGYYSTYKGVSSPGGITKLLANGDVDTSFVKGTGFSPTGNNQPMYFCRIAGETSFYVTGFWTTYKGVTYNHIVKLKENGDVDTSFNGGTGFNGTIFQAYVIWGNKLLITSSGFTAYNGTTSYYHIILNSDGSIFRTFSAHEGTGDIFIIGNDVFLSIVGQCIEKIYTYVEPTTTTTSSTSTTTSTTTVAPTTTTTTTGL